MLKKILFAILISVMIFAPLTGFCLPQGAQVVSGKATITTSKAGTMTIKTSSDKLIINYNSFNIGQNETVNFRQPSASSVALNRILGADPSSIFGTISANGRIFIINPNGILFGPGSHVNAAGLLASTLNISDADFLAGRYTFYGQGGAVVNQGYISVPGGYVALLGSTIENSGVIEANLGTVALASGEAITLNLDPKGLISVVVVKEQVTDDTQNNKEDAIKNTGRITAKGGKVILTAEALDSVFKNAINNEGIIEATTLNKKAGSVELAATGNVEDSGSITASNLIVDVAGTINAKGPIKLSKDFTLVSGNFISDVAQTFSVGGSFSLPGGTFSRFGHIVIDDKTYDIIYDVYGLQAMQGNLNGDYLLGNDIDAYETHNWPGGFYPVGQHSNPFSGTLDGRNYKVSNLYINRTNYVGLFGETATSAQIKNIGLINSNIIGGDRVGSLIGINYGSISNAYANGGSLECIINFIGGLVGINFGSISKSYANVSVINHHLTGGHTGGLVGQNSGSIFQSYATGSVEGPCQLGGLVGQNSGTVTQSYATGNVKGDESASTIGGLIGDNTSEGTISDCYARGDVEGNSYVGGLVGYNGSSRDILRSYATGRITASGSYVGGLVGYWTRGSGGSYSANFWDNTINPGLLDIGNAGDLPDNQIAAKTTAEMKQKQTYVNAGWDFTHIWAIDEGISYPYFRPDNSIVLPPISTDSIQNPVPEPVSEDNKKVLALTTEKRSK